MTFVDVIIPIPLPKLLTYRVPKSEETLVSVGMRINISLGNKKIYTGIIFNIHNNDPDYQTKYFEGILDETPILDSKHLKFWKWISDYYLCSLNDVMRAALPTSLKPESETFVSLCKDFDSELSISSTEQKVLQFIDLDKSVSVKSLLLATSNQNILSTLNSLNNKGRIDFHKNLISDYKPIYSEFIKLKGEANTLHEILDSLNRAPLQKRVIDYLIENYSGDNGFSACETKILCKQTGASRNIINSLIKKEYISFEKREASRFEAVEKTVKFPKLSETQKKAFDSVENGFETHRKVLLHGVTGSGKTEIYIHLINRAIEENKQVLYLLPEIALTTQIIRRLQAVFGNQVGVFHSKYSDSARAEVWKKLQNDDYKVILGVRSAVFLPFKNLGLVIIDEEHEISYKQFDPAPRYHARDSALVLANIFDANTVLGTATPSLESYYNCISKKYKLVELNSRYTCVEMPEIAVVDMSDAYKRKIMQEHFHPELVLAINIALNSGEQVILFQNRRGYSPYIECRDCAWIPQCKNCNVNYTYHKYQNRLICHYCGANIEMPTVCPDCGSKKVSNRGLGTEMLEDEATLFFPEAQIKRMDLDTTGTRKKYEKIIHDFEDGKIDILIGTQMVTKGLDFDNVGVVGILNADNLLNFPDFRAFERSYHLMAQVSGRAGRNKKQGKVIVQTREKEQQIIKNVVDNDYKSMFYSQMEERKLFKYPPYYKFIVLKIKNKDAKIVHRSSTVLSEALRKKLGDQVSAPVDPIVSKVFNYYIKEILIRLLPDVKLYGKKKFINEYIAWFTKQNENKGVIIQIDVDPL